MIMLGSPINGKTHEVLLRNLCHELSGDLPDMFFLGRRGEKRRGVVPMPTMARVLDLCCVHVFLQLVQRFRNQGRDRFSCLLGERDKQVFLFRRQVKRVRFHTLTIPKAPRFCKESREEDGKRAGKRRGRASFTNHSGTRNDGFSGGNLWYNKGRNLVIKRFSEDIVAMDLL